MTETNYDKWVDYPYLRLRFHLTTFRGDVQSFLIQLEYNGMMVAPSIDEWLPVVRFDHNPRSPSGHDIEEEGLHLDVLDVDGTKHDVKRGFPAVSVNNAPEYCEDHLLNYADYYACQFENRNELWGKYSTP